MESNSSKQPGRQSHTASKTLAGRSSSWPYLFCLTAVCTFLTGVVLLGGTLSMHEASTAVVLHAAGLRLERDMPETVRRAILADESLSAALAKVGLDHRAASRLAVRTVRERDDQRDDLRVTLSFADVDSLRANTLVDKLAGQCAARHHRHVRNHLRQALFNGQHQIEQLQEAKLRLDGQISNILQGLKGDAQVSLHRWDSDPFRKRLRSFAPRRHTRGDSTVLASLEDEEIAAEEIRQEISEREQELGHLYQHMTAKHPEVQLAQLDLERLKAALLNVEPIGEARLIASPEPPAPVVGSRQMLGPTQGLELDPLIAQFKQLNESHQRLAGQQRIVLDRFGNLDDTQIATLGPTAQTIRLDRSRWPRFAGLMAMLSLLAGTAMVLVARRGERAFVSADQAIRVLPVPVLGVLLRGDTSRPSAGLWAHRVHRGVRLGCEVLLAGIVLWAMLLFLFDGFLADFVSDPLGSLAMAWHRTLG